jgi:hypothetical protein
VPAPLSPLWGAEGGGNPPGLKHPLARGALNCSWRGGNPRLSNSLGRVPPSSRPLDNYAHCACAAHPEPDPVPEPVPVLLHPRARSRARSRFRSRSRSGTASCRLLGANLRHTDAAGAVNVGVKKAGGEGFGPGRVPEARVTVGQEQFSTPRAEGCLSQGPKPSPSAPQRRERSRPHRIRPRVRMGAALGRGRRST